MGCCLDRATHNILIFLAPNCPICYVPIRFIYGRRVRKRVLDRESESHASLHRLCGLRSLGRSGARSGYLRSGRKRGGSLRALRGDGAGGGAGGDRRRSKPVRYRPRPRPLFYYVESVRRWSEATKRRIGFRGYPWPIHALASIDRRRVQDRHRTRRRDRYGPEGQTDCAKRQISGRREHGSERSRFSFVDRELGPAPRIVVTLQASDTAVG